jgi:hypothetical protein
MESTRRVTPNDTFKRALYMPGSVSSLSSETTFDELPPILQPTEEVDLARLPGMHEEDSPEQEPGSALVVGVLSAIAVTVGCAAIVLGVSILLLSDPTPLQAFATLLP